MVDIKAKLMKKAVEKYGRILPTQDYKTLEECFTYEAIWRTWFFWFNTPDGNTHLVKERLEPKLEEAV